MSLNTKDPLIGQGGSHLNDQLPKIVTELRGLTVSVVAGAAAGTKMNVAAMRSEDTILSAVVSTDAGGALADDAANITIESTKATGTITISGNPVDAETFVVNGVTYTFKTTPTDQRHVKITAGNNTTMATAAAAAINAYETRYTSQGPRRAEVVATSALGVVTVTSVVDGAAGNSITLTESATNVAVSGAGTLTGGSDTGGFKSTTNLSSKSLIVIWFNKQ